MVYIVAPSFLCPVFVPVVAHKQAAGGLPVRAHHDFSGFAHRGAGTVGQDDVHVVQGAGHAHGAGLGHAAHRVVNGEGGFGLAEALHQGKARGPLPLLINFGVQRLACGGGVFNRGEVVFRQILFDEETIHGGRRAESGDVVFCKHGQDVVSVELVKIVGKDGGLVHPLAVIFSPQGLAPARVGNGEVQAVRIYVMPVFGGDIVAQGIFVVVLCNFRITRGAGGEEHQHGIGAAGCVRLPPVGVGEAFHLFVKVMPAQAVFPYHDLHVHGIAVLGRPVRLVGHLAVRSADDRFDAGRLVTVVKVVLHQQVGGGDDHRAHLVQGCDDEPELIMALEHHQHPVPPADAQGFQIIGGFRRPSADIAEGEAALCLIPGHMEHGKLFRAFFRQLIHDVKSKVKFFLIFEGHAV